MTFDDVLGLVLRANHALSKANVPPGVVPLVDVPMADWQRVMADPRMPEMGFHVRDSFAEFKLYGATVRCGK